jgi:hypothetical protein
MQMGRHPRGPHCSFRIAALLSRGGGEFPEQAVVFIIRAGGKEQLRREAAACGPAAEGECPQAVDGQSGAVGCQHRALVFSSGEVESLNGAVAKVADQQPMAERAKIGWRQCHSPGCVEPRTLFQQGHQAKIGVVDTCETESRTVVFIGAAGFPSCKRDDQVSPDILDVERHKILETVIMGREIHVLGANQVEVTVENLHSSGFEVGGVEKNSAFGLCERATFVDRLLGTIHLQGSIRRWFRLR